MKYYHETFEKWCTNVFEKNGKSYIDIKGLRLQNIQQNCWNVWNIPNVGYIDGRYDNHTVYIYNNNKYLNPYDIDNNMYGICILKDTSLNRSMYDMIFKGDKKQALLNCKHKNKVVSYVSKYILDGKY